MSNARWQSPEATRRLARRHTAEARFKLLGLGAIVLSLAFLALLLFIMLRNGLGGLDWQFLSGADSTNVSVTADAKTLVVNPVDRTALTSSCDSIIDDDPTSDFVKVAIPIEQISLGRRSAGENPLRWQVSDEPEPTGGRPALRPAHRFAVCRSPGLDDCRSRGWRGPDLPATGKIAYRSGTVGASPKRPPLDKTSGDTLHRQRSARHRKTR